MSTTELQFPRPEYHWAPERTALYNKLIGKIKKHYGENKSGPPLNPDEHRAWSWVASRAAEDVLYRLESRRVSA